ncbi:hypothetical protein WG66_009054 [Moniliophthora roreri]|nr:hypothetical protein WG66_009054 [Moniliophthora roreri]
MFDNISEYNFSRNRRHATTESTKPQKAIHGPHMHQGFPKTSFATPVSLAVLSTSTPIKRVFPPNQSILFTP